jgi:hypothetical protein
MRPLWLTIINYRSISWILVAALLAAVLLPAHYHLHHLHYPDTAGHTHVVDLHFITDNSGHAHHHENTSIISATPDAIVKTDKLVFSLFIPLAIVLVLILTCSHRVWSRYEPGEITLFRQYAYFSPPLRAPPLR